MLVHPGGKGNSFGEYQNKYLCYTTQFFTAKISSHIKGHNYTYFRVVMIKYDVYKHKVNVWPAVGRQ